MTLGSVKSLKLLTLILLLSGLSCPLFAQVQLWTTHPQVAYDLNTMATKFYQSADKSVAFKAKPIFNFNDNADLHQFEPSSGELKKLGQHTPLLVGPLKDQPWAKLAIKSGLLPNKNEIHTLKEKENEDHYWLSISGSVEFEREVNQFLKKLNLPTRDDLPWSGTIKKEALAIKELLIKKGIKKVVLAHNALIPLFKDLGSFEALVLYTEDHHHEVSARDLKRVYQWATSPSETLFIYERSLTWPAPLQTSQFNEIRKVEWNPISPYPLENLRKLFEKEL